MIDFDKIWVEKYRPAKLDDIILDDRTRNIVKEFKDEIPNLLFVGNPGTGKTTLARVIVNDILGCNYLYINASDESGIDTIRHNITNFAQTKSFDGNVKVVILDEADGLTPQAQAALRNTMETFAKYCRFILTANYKHKIIPALQSRCQALDIKPVVELAVKRCYYILKNENVKVSDEQKVKFIQLVKRHFPDLRKAINELQKNVIDSELCIANINSDNELLETIYKKVASKKTLEARKYLIENEDRFQGDYDTLLANFLNFIYNSNLDDSKKKAFVATIADHLYKSAFVVDKEINAFACLVNLENALH
jgi:DNA polymerase III delta prime subunit|tara:strand:+ start:1524 stop:2450 length:927 start_codon:yes stop_codon:yes gene_type:complete